jgi:hypothetical protein
MSDITWTKSACNPGVSKVYVSIKHLHHLGLRVKENFLSYVESIGAQDVAHETLEKGETVTTFKKFLVPGPPADFFLFTMLRQPSISRMCAMFPDSAERHGVAGNSLTYRLGGGKICLPLAMRGKQTLQVKRAHRRYLNYFCADSAPASDELWRCFHPRSRVVDYRRVSVAPT